MDLYQFKCVLAVAKYNNFNKASSELCVTPPALSQQIKRVEEELDVQLFERTTRSVKILPAGVDFINHANKIMADVSHLEDTMQKYAKGTVGTLVIGCVPILREYGIIRWIRSFVDEYPSVAIEFREDECYNLYPLLYSNDIHLAMLTAPTNLKPTNVHLKSYPLACDEFVLIVSKQHPLARRRCVQLSEIADESFIRYSQSSSLFKETVDFCHEAGFSPKFTNFETGSIDTALGFVAENIAVTLLPQKQLAGIQLSNFQIRQIQVRPKVKRTFLMVSKVAHSPEYPIANNFKDYIFNKYNLPLVCQP